MCGEIGVYSEGKYLTNIQKNNQENIWIIDKQGVSYSVENNEITN